MERRGVTEDDVQLALRHEHRRTPGEPGTIWVHGYAVGGRIAKVCVAADDETYVITVAWPD